MLERWGVEKDGYQMVIGWDTDSDTGLSKQHYPYNTRSTEQTLMYSEEKNKFEYRDMY